MDENLDEEMEIMAERDREPKILNAETFSTLIKDVVPLKGVRSLGLKTTIGEAVEIMQKNKIGSVLITDDDGVLKGIVTERDILMKVTGLITDLKGTAITQIMTADPVTLKEDDKVAYVMNNMHVGRFRHVPIVDDDEKPIGIVSIRDVVDFILDYFPEEITNITSEPFRGDSTREGA